MANYNYKFKTNKVNKNTLIAIGVTILLLTSLIFGWLFFDTKQDYKDYKNETNTQLDKIPQLEQQVHALQEDISAYDGLVIKGKSDVLFLNFSTADKTMGQYIKTGDTLTYTQLDTLTQVTKLNVIDEYDEYILDRCNVKDCPQETTVRLIKKDFLDLPVFDMATFTLTLVDTANAEVTLTEGATYTLIDYDYDCTFVESVEADGSKVPTSYASVKLTFTLALVEE